MFTFDLKTEFQPMNKIIYTCIESWEWNFSCCFGYGCFKRIQITMLLSTGFFLQYLPELVVQWIQIWANRTSIKFIASTISRWIQFCPLRWKKRYLSTLLHAGAAFASKFLSKS